MCDIDNMKCCEQVILLPVIIQVATEKGKKKSCDGSLRMKFNLEALFIVLTQKYGFFIARQLCVLLTLFLRAKKGPKFGITFLNHQ